MSILLSFLTLFLRFVLHLSLSFTFFIFSCLIFSTSPGFTKVNFSSGSGEDMPLDLSFMDQTTPTPQSSVCPPYDSDMADAYFTKSHFLSLDLFSLTSS